MLKCAKFLSKIFLAILLVTGCVPYSNVSGPDLTRSNEKYSSNNHGPGPVDVKELEGTYIGFLPCENKYINGREIILTLQDLEYDYKIKNVYGRSGSDSKGKIKYDVDLGRIFIDKLNVTFKVELLQDAYKLVLVDTSGAEIKDKIGVNYTLFKLKNSDFSDRTMLRKNLSCPTGYSKVRSLNEFADFLKKISLIPELAYDTETAVTFFGYNYMYHASFNLRPGNTDFNEGNNQIIRLLAEFNWFNKKYKRIVFSNYYDRQISYKEWLKFNYEYKEESYESLWAYLNSLFSDGSAKFPETVKVKADDIQIGDIFMSDNYFEKVVIVVDIAEDKLTGRKIVVLAQGSKNLPGLHILLNSSNTYLEKWFETDGVIFTPEGNFDINDLRRFKDDK